MWLVFFGSVEPDSRPTIVIRTPLNNSLFSVLLIKGFAVYYRIMISDTLMNEY